MFVGFAGPPLFLCFGGGGGGGTEFGPARRFHGSPPISPGKLAQRVIFAVNVAALPGHGHWRRSRSALGSTVSSRCWRGRSPRGHRSRGAARHSSVVPPRWRGGGAAGFRVWHGAAFATGRGSRHSPLVFAHDAVFRSSAERLGRHAMTAQRTLATIPSNELTVGVQVDVAEVFFSGRLKFQRLPRDAGGPGTRYARAAGGHGASSARRSVAATLGGIFARTASREFDWRRSQGAGGLVARLSGGLTGKFAGQRSPVPPARGRARTKAPQAPLPDGARLGRKSTRRGTRRYFRPSAHLFLAPPLARFFPMPEAAKVARSG